MILRISKLELQGAASFSKWQHIQVLLEDFELRALFSKLEPFSLFPTGSIHQNPITSITTKTFTENYKTYLQELKAKSILCPQTMRAFFSCAMTQEENAICQAQLEKNAYKVQYLAPFVLIQPFYFVLSSGEKHFQPMILGKKSISWGLRFSYPLLFQSPKSSKIQKVTKDKAFPNSKLFFTLQKWIRHNTLPPCFIHQNKKYTFPLRLGKKCFPWIHTHPQFAKNSPFTLVSLQ